MTDFEGSPQIFSFGQLTLTRDDHGSYTVTMEGVEGQVGTVSPYDISDYGWLHGQTGRSGQVADLAAAAKAILGIEQTRSN